MTYKYQLHNIFKIVPILFLLVSCGYKSEFEALQACEEWASKQEDIYLITYNFVTRKEPTVGGVGTAKCRKDGKDTRKILGLKLNRKNYGSKEFPVGDTKYWDLIFSDENFKVIKRFSY